jgi:hypothetical protein
MSDRNFNNIELLYANFVESFFKNSTDLNAYAYLLLFPKNITVNYLFEG